jgi:hypothetical protein
LSFLDDESPLRIVFEDALVSQRLVSQRNDLPRLSQNKATASFNCRRPAAKLYRKSGNQVQEHPDGLSEQVSLLSLWKMKAPGIIESDLTSALV